MPVPALTLLCARLQAAAYNDTYLATGVIDLSPFSPRVKTATIWANDPTVGRVRHGFISIDGQLPIWNFDGTLIPKGSFVEWLDNFDAFLAPSPWNPGDKVHRGMLRFYKSLSVVDDASGVETPLSDYIAANAEASKRAIFVGHSLGTFTATCACLEASGVGLFLFAAPKPGDGCFRQTVFDALKEVGGVLESYANPNDAVPRLPITVDFPWKFEDFEAIIDPTELQPTLVSPPIESDWLSSHHMPNYVLLLEALALLP
jgi:hypothetical protein